MSPRMIEQNAMARGVTGMRHGLTEATKSSGHCETGKSTMAMPTVCFLSHAFVITCSPRFARYFSGSENTYRDRVLLLERRYEDPRSSICCEGRSAKAEIENTPVEYGSRLTFALASGKALALRKLFDKWNTE